MNSSFKLLNYNVTGILWRSSDRVAYSATRTSDNIKVVLETIDAQYPARNVAANLRREGNITQFLSDIQGVRNVHNIIPYGSGNILLECEPYEYTLKQFLKNTNHQHSSLIHKLEISVNVINTIGKIHLKDIVHKALAPQHILMNNLNGHISLSGFSIASELDQELQSTQLPTQLQDTLPYISPEQTGRMNRDLDYRSDYYSIGVLLFELFTGQLPFEAKDNLEWVYNHICLLPPNPRTILPEIPNAIANIILKLLAKCPEDRYQNISSLKNDIQFCLDILIKNKKLEPFALGTRGAVQKFLVPQNLYGREDELKKLLDLFEQAVKGKTRFCLVHGYSGVGKSVLVNEIDRFQVREQGFLVQSKFDQFQRSEAYSALIVTYRALVQQVLQLPKYKLDYWSKRLQAALSPNASLILELIPELELIIGKQPPIPDLPPAEARNRQHIVLASFLRAFAAQGHPVVLFLDDLHWSDTPTLELLRRIVTSREQSHLLLIAAYRSNEVNAGHPLRKLLNDLKTHNNMYDLPIEPLKKHSVAQLVSDSLSCHIDEPAPLTDLLFNKAKGNPFFTNELLRQLHKQGAITANKTSSSWDWCIDSINWTNVNNDVVGFMIKNLRQLPMATQQILQLAACIGGSFNLQILSTISQLSLTETASALVPALKEYTVQPLHSDYNLVNSHSETIDLKLDYRFQHDRVQQAAYELIKTEDLAKVHLSIGRLILKQFNNDIPNKHLSNIVNHFNQGLSLISSVEERIEISILNLKAGQRSKNASSYKVALEYLLISKNLLPSNAWNKQPKYMPLLAKELQQCYYLTGDTQQADSWIDIMLTHAESDLQRSDILATRTRQYATLGRMTDSIKAAIQGLSLLGINFSEEPTLDDINAEQRLVNNNLAGREIADLVDATIVENSSILTSMRLLMEIFPAAFLSGSGNLFPYLVLKSVNLSLRHGNCPESAFAYTAYGMLLCGELDDPALGYQYGKLGLAVNEQLDDLTLRSRVIYVYAMFIHHWSNHWSTLTPLFKKGIESGYQSGDLLYLAYSAQDCVIWNPTQDLETAERLHAENIEIVRECAYQDSLDSGTLFLQYQRNLLNKTNSELSLSDASFNQDVCFKGMQQRQFMTGIANHNIYSAEICVLYGNYEEALPMIKAQDLLIKSAMSLPQLVRFYITANLTLSMHYPNMSSSEQTETLIRLNTDLDRMTRWANNCEDNFRHLQYLMKAEIERITGNNLSALQYYDRSIKAAKKSNFLRDEAVACERAACHLLNQNQPMQAEGYLRATFKIYEHWGAKRKTKWLLQKYPVLHELTAKKQTNIKDITESNLNLASIMKASREISGEIVLEQLLQKSMSVLLENAGAQWGCLVVYHEEIFTIEAIEFSQESSSIIEIPEHMYVACNNGHKVPLPTTLINKAFFSNQSVILHDAFNQGQYARDPYISAQQARSVLCIPIKRERFEGVLYLENNLASGIFTNERVEIIRLLAAQALVAIENSRLYKQVQEYSHTLEAKVAKRTARLEKLNKELQDIAELDGLTGVANRRRCDNYLQEVWLRLKREKLPISIIMIDVDHFKAYNDNYGHQAGDNCLIQVAQAVKSELHRVDDLIARYGGEEFIIILPNTDDNGAACIGEQVRATIESLAIEHCYSLNSKVVTVSAGTATVTPTEYLNVKELVNQADKALYKAKQLGRNRIEVRTNIFKKEKKIISI